MSALPNGGPIKLDSNPAAPAVKLLNSTTTTTTTAAAAAAAAKTTHNVRDSTSIAEVRTALTALHARESLVAKRLDGLLSAQADLGRDLAVLDHLRAGLSRQVIAARAVGNDMLASAADTAGRLSDKVRELDLEKGRVEDTLRVVEQVAELKACVQGVVGSMGAPQDWEAAAGYVARADLVPEEIVRGGFAASIVPSVEVPDAPWVTLENAKESLCNLFLREFEKAAKEGDSAKVTRFFKLFPLIGRGDVGLDVYGRYVCQGVAGTARTTLKEGNDVLQGRREGFFYANSLVKLFDHIARIVEGHGSIVERHYGAGKMIKVIERLQIEADVQGGIILDSWSDERSVDRRLTDVKSYPFSFLVQSFLPQQRSSTPRVNSPALGAGAANTRSSEDEGVNMKEVDALLNEITVMLERWALYARFLAGKCRDASEADDAPLAIPELLVKSSLNRKVSAKLTTPYNVMTTFFFRRSVEKAFQLDEFPSGLSLSLNKPIDSNPPYIIQAVDDVMYIVNNVIQKSMSTSQRDVVAAVIPTIGRLLEADFVGMIQRRMRDEAYPKSLVHGGFPPEDKIIAFIVLINSLDISNEYLARIISGQIGPIDGQTNGASYNHGLKDSFPFDHDVNFVISTLSRLQSSFTAKSTELLNEGLQILFTQVVKSRLRPVLSDTFRDADYSLTEEEMAEIARQNEEDEEVMLEQAARNFEHGWDQLMKPVLRIMTPKTFAVLLDLTAKYLSKILEKRIWSSAGKISAYGAIRMERDMSGIVGAVSKGNYGVRELFARVTQILMVVNMEDDEWEEIAASEEEMQWVLTEDERRKARNVVRE